MLKTCFSSLLAIAAASPAFAQIADDPENAADTVLVTASRSGEGVPLSQLAASATVLDAAALEQRQTRIVSDILRDVPGVAVSRLGGVGGQTQLRIRGTEGNHVLVLIDGIEAADPFYGEFDFGTLIADPEARIEVLRGQQSALYGSDAIGGVINYITLSGAEAPGFVTRAEGGSFGTFNGAARAAGADGDFDYAVSGGYNRTKGFATARNGSRELGSEIGAASAKLNWTPSAGFKLSAVGRYSTTAAETNDSESDFSSPLFGYIVDTPGARFVNRAFYGLVRAEVTALDGRWTNSVSAQIVDATRRNYDATGRTGGDKGQRYKGSLVSSLRLDTGAVTHRITGAVDLEREQFRNTTPSSFTFQGRRDTENLGLVGQYELTAGGLSFGGSVRHDDNNRFDDATTWRVQGSYRLPGGTRVRAAYGTGVKNPGYYELYGFSDGRYIGNPNLKPEKSEGWEAGIEQSFGEGRATIGATWFDSTLKDEIFTDFPPPTFIASPGNRTTESTQHGVEAFVAARPISQLRLDAAYTYLKARENGMQEVRRPTHIASFNATVFSTDQRFSSTLTLRYNGRMRDAAFTDPSFVPVTVSLREYALVNLAASYALTSGVSLFGRVENLFGEEYEEVFSYATPGRAAYGGLRVAF